MSNAHVTYVCHICMWRMCMWLMYVTWEYVECVYVLLKTICMWLFPAHDAWTRHCVFCIVTQMMLFSWIDVHMYDSYTICMCFSKRLYVYDRVVHCMYVCLGRYCFCGLQTYSLVYVCVICVIAQVYMNVLVHITCLLCVIENRVFFIVFLYCTRCASMYILCMYIHICTINICVYMRVCMYLYTYL